MHISRSGSGRLQRLDEVLEGSGADPQMLRSGSGRFRCRG